MSLGLSKLAFFTLWLFIFSLPWERTAPLPVVGSVGSLLGLLAFGVGFTSLFSRRGFHIRRPSLFLLVAAAFALWSLLSYYWSIVPTATLGRAQTNVQLFLVVFLVWQLCRSEQQLRSLFQAYILGAYLSCASILASFLLGTSYAGSGRYSGLSGDNPNWIAITLALGVPIAWHIAGSYKNSFMSWLNFLYLPVALFAIGLTASRGGLITALVGASLVFLSFRSLSLPRKVFLLLLIPGAIYGLLSVVPPENLLRLSEASTEISEGDLTSRGTIWEAGFRIIAERPWLGYGSGGFPTAVAPELGYAINAHNSFISVAGELGVVGVTLFAALFLLALTPFLLPNTPDRWFYLVLWLAVVIANTPAAWEYNKATWLMLALITTRKAFVVPLPTRAQPLRTPPGFRLPPPWPDAAGHDQNA